MLLKEKFLNKKNNKIIILGGNGFIGSALLNELFVLKYSDITVMSRQKLNKTPKSIKHILGDFEDLSKLKSILIEYDIIINLINLTNNVEKLANEFIKIFDLGKSKKIIHLSSISVYGPQYTRVVNEDTKCIASDDYANKKRLFDEIIFDFPLKKSKLIILRPTIVFGANSKNLVNNIIKYKDENFIIKCLKKSLFYNRKVNLISINTLVDCIIFIIEKTIEKNEIFIVSEDDCKKNNYLFLYSLFDSALNTKNILPPLNLPVFIGNFLFILFKKNNHGLNVEFSNSKLINFGYKNKYNFSTELKKFIFNDLKKLKNVI